MQLVPLLVLLHVGTTAALLGLLAVVVAGQRARALLRARRRVAAVRLRRAAQPARAAPAAGASVLEWTVDLRGVGQREAVLRT